MKALTLTQPWASLVTLGHKRVETRSWSTRYRGPIAIHAAAKFPGPAMLVAWEQKRAGRIPDPLVLPLGMVLATARLVTIQRTDAISGCLFVSALERSLGDYSPGRFAWFLEDITALPKPVAVRGALGLWEWEPA